VTLEGEPDPTWSLDALIERAIALSASPDDVTDAYWTIVDLIRGKGDEETWDRIALLTQEATPAARALVPDVLRFHGQPSNRALYRERTLSLFRSMLQRDRDPLVISSIGNAFVDLDLPDGAMELMLPFATDEDPVVRRSVVHALLGNRDAKAIAALIDLSRDSDTHVRDWATFGLGSQLGELEDPYLVDTPDLREALAARLTDPDPDTRQEATVGLAVRRDPRAIEAVKSAFLQGEEGWLHVEAAHALASRELVGVLEEAARSGDEYWKKGGHLTLEQALAACRGEAAARSK
jgi:HEAT repeat protein